MNGNIDNFRRGVVTWVIDGEIGTIRQIVADRQSNTSTEFNLADARFVEADVVRRDLFFGNRYRTEGDTITTLRNPEVGDIVMYTDKLVDGRLYATAWTFEGIYKTAEDKLPRCVAKDCKNAPRLRERYCASHALSDNEDDLYNDDTVSTTEVYDRARRVIRDPEQAREAATTCPGDFI